MVLARRSWIAGAKSGISALWLPAAATLGLVAGGIVWMRAPVAQNHLLANHIWLASVLVTGSIVAGRTIVGALRGHWASDVIATLAIGTAVVLQQPIPGLIIVIMQTGGEALERFAEGRASDAVRALESDRPQRAHVIRPGPASSPSDAVGDTVASTDVGADVGAAIGAAIGVISDVAATDVHVGDVLLVRPGELVPCDGVVTEGRAELDTSRLTGEPLPVSIAAGDVVRSGSINGSRPFQMRATAASAESQYARIVELVRTAQTTKAPFQRLADRYAVWFTPLAIVIAAGAAILSGHVDRALAVLVVATPCPLILAPPIAIIGGINRAARRQIILRTGAAMERLARVDVAVFDKTGTLTIGTPMVSNVIPFAPFTRGAILRLAGSVEQGSSHLLARTLVTSAATEAVALVPATDTVETAGRGVTGIVDGHTVSVGSRSFIESMLSDDGRVALAKTPAEGLRAYVGVDGDLAGTVVYADRIRAGVSAVLAALRALGVQRMVLLTGDHPENARSVASAVGISDVESDLTPEGKVDAIRALAGDHEVLMIGDGTNDAPALSTAAVGVALAGHGGGVTAEAADVVVLADDLQRIPAAIEISRRTMAIARQSMWVGMGLSAVAMIFAAAGYIAPVGGAVLQELIDVAVILNALRASRSVRISSEFRLFALGAWLCVSCLARPLAAESLGMQSPRRDTDTVFQSVARRILEVRRDPVMRWPDLRDVTPVLREVYHVVYHVRGMDSAANATVDSRRALGPLWFRDGHPTLEAASVARVLANANARGLRAGDYDAATLLPQFMEQVPDRGFARAFTDTEMARLDLAMTANAVRFARALRFGRIRATDAHAALHLPRDTMSMAAFIHALATSDARAGVPGDLDGWVKTQFDALEPPWTHYWLLRWTLDQYRSWAAGLSPLPPDFTQTMVAERIRRIELSLERWRWLPHTFAAPPVFINIPAFRLYAFSVPHTDAESTLVAMDVAVGQAFKTETPVFSATLQTVIFSPYWDVPLSIARKELIPNARRDMGSLSRAHMEIVSVPAGRSLPLTSASLSEVLAGRARIRQRPGPDNALGGVKFVFPNDYNVYLHDTPVRSTFELLRRDVSHGCIRVAEAARLAAFVLRDQPEWTAARIDSAMHRSQPISVSLDRPIPVFIMYATVIARADGTTRFYDDIYGHDRQLARLLARGYPYE